MVARRDPVPLPDAVSLHALAAKCRRLAIAADNERTAKVLNAMADEYDATVATLDEARKPFR